MEAKAGKSILLPRTKLLSGSLSSEIGSPSQARQKKRMMFGDQHLARFGSMTGKQGADVAQQLAVDEQEQQAQVHCTITSCGPGDRAISPHPTCIKWEPLMHGL